MFFFLYRKIINKWNKKNTHVLKKSWTFISNNDGILNRGGNGILLVCIKTTQKNEQLQNVNEEN